MARNRQPPLPDTVSSKLIDTNEILSIARAVGALSISDIESIQRRLPDAETMAKVAAYRSAIYAYSHANFFRTPLSQAFDRLLKSVDADMLVLYSPTDSTGQVNFVKFNPKNKTKGTVVAYTTLHNFVGALSPIVESGMKGLIKSILDDEENASRHGHFPDLAFYGTCAFVIGLKTPATLCAMKLGAYGAVGHTAAWLVSGKTKSRVVNNDGRITIDGTPVATNYIKRAAREAVQFTDEPSSFRFDYENIEHITIAKPKPKKPEVQPAQTAAPAAQKRTPLPPPAIVEPSIQVASSSDSDEGEITLK